MADGTIPLTTVHVTPTWLTYTAPFPFARRNVEISFRIGENQEHFSELIRAGGEDTLELFLFSFETVNLTPTTFLEAHKRNDFEWHLPADERLRDAENRVRSAEERLNAAEERLAASEERLKSAEERLKIAENEIAQINRLVPARLAAAEDRLKAAEDKLAHLNKLLPIRLYRKLRGRD
jgi:hypothetical protein